jgi:PAS domain S-box-containing protein
MDNRARQVRLNEVKTTLEALRHQEVDAIIGSSQVLVVRQQKIDQSLRQQAQIIEQIHDAVVVTDLEGNISHWNTSATRLYGYSAEEALGLQISLLYFDEELSMLDQQILTLLHTQNIQEIDTRCRRKTGEACYIHLSVSLLRDEQGNPCGLINCAEDITERKWVEAERERLLAELEQERIQLRQLNQTLKQEVQAQTQQVRELAAELSLAEYRERKRVSQVLHDHLQQLLYGLQFITRSIRLDADESQIVRLDQVDDLLKQAAQTTRTLSVELSPPELEHRGLSGGLSWLADEMQKMHGLEVTLDIQADAGIANKHLEVLVFQMVRELLFNVVKHAQIDQAEVILRQTKDSLLVTVKDDGQGSDLSELPEQTDTRTGFGLRSIHDRVDLFGGHMELHSAPGVGTQVFLSLPLQSSPTAGVLVSTIP